MRSIFSILDERCTTENDLGRGRRSAFSESAGDAEDGQLLGVLLPGVLLVVLGEGSAEPRPESLLVLAAAKRT